MTPAGLLVCITFITNVNHGSVVTHDCHDERPQVVMATEGFTMPYASIFSIPQQLPKAEPKKRAVSYVQPKATHRKLHYRKYAFRKTRIHHYASRIIVKPDDPPERKSILDFSWLKQLAGG